MTVKKNSKIQVHYVGMLDDGSIFDKSPEGQPLEFVVGTGQVIPGFDQAVEGMVLNEDKKITVNADNAYGQRNEKLVGEFPKTSLPEGFVPKIGMIITLNDKEGRAFPATVIGIAEQSITIDLNHPLAGKNLTFTIKIVAIN